MFNKSYHYSQIKSKALQYLKFILKKDIEFNNKIIIVVIYLDKKSILHVVDAATAFQARKFQNSMSK